MHLDISPEQYEKLESLAKGAGLYYAVFEPNETDSEEHRNETLNYIRNAQDLVTKGMLQDMSSNEYFIPIIAQVKQDNNRNCKIYALTEISVMLFSPLANKTIN